jgi:hypothetical protein
MSAYAIAGQYDTWQMYLHGPHFRPSEREGKGVPPVYVFGTWVNKVYKFENISTSAGGPMEATLKVVGHALAPSTGWPVEDKGGRVNGLLVAEGQPFWIANDPHAPAMSLYKGGVSFIPAARANCTQIFPDSSSIHKQFGQVTNTVDCHKDLGICFFSVWKFYDDAFPFWDKISEYMANDCLYYCIATGLDSEPSCEEIAVVRDENGEPICHQDGVGAVHGFTIGNTDPQDKQKFDLLLVFTGELHFVSGESSMRKVTVRATNTNGKRGLQTERSAAFATDLFVDYPPAGNDVGGDHVWVDDSGRYVWVSAFRKSGAGLHMLEYDTGRLLYSVKGFDKYLDGQFTYSAGVHGVGTLGEPGSYLALATSGCRAASACMPLPWTKPIPKEDWSKGVFFIVDLASADINKTTAIFI